MAIIEKDRITIRSPDDMHLHLRWDERLYHAIQHTFSHWGRGIIMPNTDENRPILTSKDVKEYRNEIFNFLHQFLATHAFEPLMTIKLVKTTTFEVVHAAAEAGVKAIKSYPLGVTTNSENGVSMNDLVTEFGGVFKAMEERGMVLSLHGEHPEYFCLDREDYFIPVLRQMQANHPGLKIVLEHITTKNAVQLVQQDTTGNLAATITLHHLFLTLDDVIGGSLMPHNFCKPLAKRPEDRDALISAVISGNPKFFFGSDSAPHFQHTKESACGCAGVFSAPVALPLLTSFFDEQDALEKLEPFVSQFGAQFYGLPLNRGTVTIERGSWTVPLLYSDSGSLRQLVPFWAGREISWNVVVRHCQLYE
ncbi:dihydroorotase [Patescibacteria group bacterium]|nr:dihydroorotase [Patescibacteria group bacterium]MBU1895309.1 dihydroorotase [Patescibacteria group bacterium]